MKTGNELPVGRERNALTRPFMSLQREIDRLFDDFGRGVGFFRGTLPRMDVTETDGEIQIKADMPGLTDKDITVDLADDVLTIRGERKEEKDEKEKDYVLYERSHEVQERSVRLPAGVDSDRIKAHIQDGVLTVSVPKPAKAETKKIEVRQAR